PMLKQQIEALGDVRLVIIDHLEAYTGAGPRSQKMRALLGSLEALAEECGIPVVVNSSCQKCELPVKYVWRVDGEITNPDLRWMVPVRCDGSETATALAFKFSQGGLNWDQQDYTFHEDQMQGCSAKVQRQQPQRDVAKWLKKYLGRDLPHLVEDVLAEGARQGYSASRVQRARVALNAVSYKDKEPHGQWFWEITDRSIPLNLREPAVTSSEGRTASKRKAEASKPRKASSEPVGQDVFVATDWDLVPKKPVPTAEE
ncbi:MAG: hypothetical protein JWN70_2714, partial [Planctomycetaceae bacterium]|nr:hypothetical protein [Planctomycetaceae bacterium]